MASFTARSLLPVPGAQAAKERDTIRLDVGHSGKRYTNVEVKHSGPDGVMLDVSETGWVGTSDFRP